MLSTSTTTSGRERPSAHEPRRACGLASRPGRGRVGRHEPGSERSGLPGWTLLARAGVADPQLGPPTRSRSLRLPDSCRGGSARDRRAGAKRGLLRALQPRDGSRPGWRAVRVDGGSGTRPPVRERGCTEGAPGRGVGPLTSFPFFVISAWQLEGRVRWSRASFRNRRSMVSGLPRRRFAELRSRVCVCSSQQRTLPTGIRRFS